MKPETYPQWKRRFEAFLDSLRDGCPNPESAIEWWESQNPRPIQRHVFTFQPRFVPGVKAGTKTSTIRLPRKRKVFVNDILDFRTWSGLPYRSKQFNLFEVKCVSVEAVQITVFDVIIEGYKLTDTELGMLAKSEGFGGSNDMLDWFSENHELPLNGTLYRWQP